MQRCQHAKLQRRNTPGNQIRVSKCSLSIRSHSGVKVFPKSNQTYSKLMEDLAQANSQLPPSQDLCSSKKRMDKPDSRSSSVSLAGMGYINLIPGLNRLCRRARDGRSIETEDGVSFGQRCPSLNPFLLTLLCGRYLKQASSRGFSSELKHSNTSYVDKSVSESDVFRFSWTAL